MKEKDPDRFRVGDVWETTKGFLYKVMSVEVGGQAVLRSGSDGSGRIIRKKWDDIGWWTRISCGEENE